ncbi:hypothetical protein GCM10009122_19200 [Fulvivirga kasyanovii]|uniref:DUF6268 domain-containing protein n=1 Tax=Fulvivirga kasyanovii TaxID=396812 RepID=A0ABW9RJE1_9BACT|nr:DUF6268 family outer membrane beta-barrel protein [Fulvivirga kasyanovii]MTI24194.1 hypothetical protein [Fulvivirga kasyanovii]
MKKIFSTVFILQLFCFAVVNAQVEKEEAPELDKVIAIPYRPKIAEFSYNTLGEYNTYCTSDEFGNSSSEVERDSQLKLRLGIPLVMKDSKLFGIQLKYDRHNFVLDFEDSPEHYELYDHIERRSFTSLGARFLFQKSLDDTRELTVIAGGEIKSDEIVLNKNTGKYYTHIAYSKQLNKRTKIGAGLMMSYTLGRPQVYPLVSYERRLSSKWTLDLNLPKQAALRYRANEKFYITASTEVKGWRYAVNNAVLSEENHGLTLRKSDINFGLSFEHEVHDWLWLGLDMGLSKNLRYFLAEPGDGRKDAVIDLTADDTPYVKFGLFIVPPKKMYLK